MSSLFLRTLPSARLLAAALVLVASGLHFAGSLPEAWLATGMLLALPVVLAAGMIAGRLAAGTVVTAARALAALLAVAPWLLWQVHDGLAQRLPPGLEGRDLVVVGVVDAMPQRFDFGDRIRFTVDDCGVLEPDRKPERGSVGIRRDVAGGCGRLQRVQLDWGPPRARDRSDGDLSPAGEAGGIDPGDQDDEAADGALAGAVRRSSDGSRSEEIWPEPGQTWRLTVRLKRPVATVNPGGFDLELRYLQQGVGAVGRVYARQRLTAPASTAWRPGFRILVVFESLRSGLRDRLEAVYSHRVDPASSGAGAGWPMLGVVAALALGDQGAISPGLWGVFSRTGVSHLMAISGMHVTMLALVVAWLAAHLLKRLTIWRIPGISRLVGCWPRQVLVLLIAVLAAFGYALLSGWGIPSQRTCWMLTAAAIMSLSGRGRGAVDITLMAAAAVLVVDPWATSTAGFWLSFGAVAAILWCAHGQADWREMPAAVNASVKASGGQGARIPRLLREAVTSQWAATVGLAPLVAALFSVLSLVGPLANALAIPWVSFLITPLAVAAALLAPVSESACSVLLQVNLWMIERLVALLHLLDQLPAASVAIARPETWTLGAAIIGAIAVMAPAGMPLRAAGLLCMLPMLLAPPQSAPDDALWITALDIGQGSSILVEVGARRLLFDTGSGSGPDRSAASRHLVPYLRSRGIDSIDTLLVSHLDVEHAGGVAAVLQSLRPVRLVTSFDPALLPAEPEALAAPSHVSCLADHRFSLGSATVEMLHPIEAASLRKAARDNGGSCVIRIVSPAGSVLLPGDLPASADTALIKRLERSEKSQESGRAKIKTDVLIVPQQGSRQAASAPFLAAVGPSVALVQVGYRNRHRHPHPAVLARLASIGATVLRTDLDGAIQIRLRPGHSPEVRRLRRDAPPYWRVETEPALPQTPIKS